MINCYKCESLFSSYLEQDISDQNKRDVEHHLDVCDRCDEKLEQIQTLKKSLPALPRYKTSASFDSVLRARIRHEAKRGNTLSWFPSLNFSWQIPAMAAVTVCVVIIGLLAVKNPGIMNMQEQNIVQNETAQPVQQTSTQPIQVTRYVNVAEHFANSSASTELNSSSGSKQSTIDSLKKRQRMNDLQPIINRASTTVKF